MRSLFLSFIIGASLTSGQTTKEIKATEVHSHSKNLLGDLQTMYVELKNTLEKEHATNNDKQQAVLKAMAESYRSLMTLTTEAEANNKFTASKHTAVNQAISQLEEASSSTILVNNLDSTLTTWISSAQTFSQSIVPFATLAEAIDGNDAEIRLNRTRTSSNTLISVNTAPNTHLTVTSTTPGLETPESRVELVERITELNAGFSRNLTNARTVNTGNLQIQPPVFPSAYIFSNGTPGNVSPIGGRDILTPIFNNRRTPTRVKREPIIRVNF